MLFGPERADFRFCAKKMRGIRPLHRFSHKNLENPPFESILSLHAALKNGYRYASLQATELAEGPKAHQGEHGTGQVLLRPRKLKEQASPELRCSFTTTFAIAGIGTFVVLPLCFAETLSAARHISSVNFGAFIIVILAILGRSTETIIDAKHPLKGVRAFSPGWAAALPIAVFGLQCHAQVVAVFNELRIVRKDELEGPSVISLGGKLRTHKLRAMTKVIITASK